MFQAKNKGRKEGRKWEGKGKQEEGEGEKKGRGRGGGKGMEEEERGRGDEGGRREEGICIHQSQFQRWVSIKLAQGCAQRLDFLSSSHSSFPIALLYSVYYTWSEELTVEQVHIRSFCLLILPPILERLRIPVRKLTHHREVLSD